MVCFLVFVVVVVVFVDVVVDGGGGGGSGGGVLFWSLREEAIPFQTTSEILIRSLFPIDFCLGGLGNNKAEWPRIT